ncbi:hypothetical protein FJ366_02995 [Candidatus Dependentiae bacterium]|nr:hypothetical protein [Candidatus Dependentiae bacterium]
MKKTQISSFLFILALFLWTPKVKGFTYAIEKTVEHWLLEGIKRSENKNKWALLTSLSYSAWHIGQVVWPQFFPVDLRLKLGISTLSEYKQQLSDQDELYLQKIRRLKKIEEIITDIQNKTGQTITSIYIKKNASCAVKAVRFFTKNSLIINEFWLETPTTKEPELFKNFSVMSCHEFAHFNYYHHEITLLALCTISFVKCFYAAANSASQAQAWNLAMNRENLWKNASRAFNFYSKHDIPWLMLSALNRMFVHESDHFLLKFHSTKEFIKALEFATLAEITKKNKSPKTKLSSVGQIIKYGTEWINNCFKLYGYSNYPSIRQRMLCAKKQNGAYKNIFDILPDIDHWIWW